MYTKALEKLKVIYFSRISGPLSRHSRRNEFSARRVIIFLPQNDCFDIREFHCYRSHSFLRAILQIRALISRSSSLSFSTFCARYKKFQFCRIANCERVMRNFGKQFKCKYILQLRNSYSRSLTLLDNPLFLLKPSEIRAISSEFCCRSKN